MAAREVCSEELRPPVKCPLDLMESLIEALRAPQGPLSAMTCYATCIAQGASDCGGKTENT